MKSNVPSTHTASTWRAALAGVAALAVLALPAVLIAAGPPSLAAPQQVVKVADPQVHIDNFQFSPSPGKSGRAPAQNPHYLFSSAASMWQREKSQET